jgi:hypothetical protein
MFYSLVMHLLQIFSTKWDKSILSHSKSFDIACIYLRILFLVIRVSEAHHIHNGSQNDTTHPLVAHFTIYTTTSFKFCLPCLSAVLAISHNLTCIHHTIYWLLMCTMCQANLFINYSFKAPSPLLLTLSLFFITP